MKLSDLFTNLADGARNFEGRVKKWQEDLEAKNDELEAGARRWQEDAAKRQEELKQKVQGYLDDASDNVRAQWAKMEAGWDKQVAETKAKALEFRDKVDASDAEDYADWSEAYAANMVSYAQQMQDEASNAVAAAAEARARAEAAKSKVG